jgi:redox-sensitive bicupin YhaK (pirin superfamily)
MTRQVEQRVRGQQHGFIRRLISPGDLGERLKPFVFLDYLHGQIQPGTGFGFHPHSGIATLTYQLNADVEYEDTAGQKGRVRATGLEWMRAGGGTWHQGRIHPKSDFAEGFQLWLALPPGVEDGPPEGLYVPPEQVPQVSNVRVLLGSYAGVHNPLPAPSPVDYLTWRWGQQSALPISHPAVTKSPGRSSTAGACALAMKRRQASCSFSTRRKPL